MRRSKVKIGRTPSATASLFAQLNQVVAQHHSPLGQIARENLATNKDGVSAESDSDNSILLYKSI